MKKLTSIILILFLSLLSSPSWSDTLNMGDLVWRDGLYYEKFSQIPFTGEIIGLNSLLQNYEQGSMVNGKEVGKWVGYWENGQLWYKGEYNKDGKEVGKWVSYHENLHGQWGWKGEFNDNGKKVGEWIEYYSNGQLKEKGDYKDGKKVGEWVYYDKEGNLLVK